MSFLSKIKQGLGIGTVKLSLDVPPSISAESGEIKGRVVVAAQSDQKVTSLKIKLKETFTSGRGDDKEEREFDIGEISYDQAFDLKTGESRTVDFVLPFALRKSDMKALSEEKGALGALGKAALLAGGEKSEYELDVDVKLEGTMLSPSESKSITII